MSCSPLARTERRGVLAPPVVVLTLVVSEGAAEVVVEVGLRGTASLVIVVPLPLTHRSVRHGGSRHRPPVPSPPPVRSPPSCSCPGYDRTRPAHHRSVNVTVVHTCRGGGGVSGKRVRNRKRYLVRSPGRRPRKRTCRSGPNALPVVLPWVGEGLVENETGDGSTGSTGPGPRGVGGGPTPERVRRHTPRVSPTHLTPDESGTTTTSRRSV